MRKKEGLADYRYFPEPDLPEVIFTEEYVNGIRDSLPELPELKRRRYEEMGLSMQDVLFLANDVNVCHKDKKGINVFLHRQDIKTKSMSRLFRWD